MTQVTRYKDVHGWWCPCTGPQAGPGHSAAACPRGVAVVTRLPDEPGWRMPRPPVRPRAAPAPVVEAAHPVRPQDAPCRPARRLEALAVAVLGRDRVTVTRALAWGRRLVPGLGEEPGGYVPALVESRAVRASGLAWACWTRLEDPAAEGGWSRWVASGAMMVTDGRAARSTATAVSGRLRSLADAGGRGARDAGD